MQARSKGSCDWMYILQRNSHCIFVWRQRLQSCNVHTHQNLSRDLHTDSEKEGNFGHCVYFNLRLNCSSTWAAGPKVSATASTKISKSNLGSVPGQVMWDLWWTKWHWERFLTSTSVSPANSHSTHCPTWIVIYHPELVGTIDHNSTNVSSGLYYLTT
jgi:hypothetical protein